MTDERLKEMRADELREADLVDLDSCPYLNYHVSAEFELAEVSYVEHEPTGIVCIGYEGVSTVGYGADQKLMVYRPD